MSSWLKIHRVASPLRGDVHLSGDKSLSHRAFIFASMATGITRVKNVLDGDDIKATIGALQALGVLIRQEGDDFCVHGRGGVGFVSPVHGLDCGNSGTTARLLSGMLAGLEVSAVLDGDASLAQRPMGRIMEPLRFLGAHLEARDNNYLPLMVRGNSSLLAGAWRSDVASAQVKSAFLLAGLNAQGESCYHEPLVSRDHSEIMLEFFGGTLMRTYLEDGGLELRLRGHQILRAPQEKLILAGDPSSAALIATAIILTQGAGCFHNLLVNPLRVCFFEWVKKMGVRVVLKDKKRGGGEEVAHLHVSATQSLNAIHIPACDAPRLIDEYPALAILASCGCGTSRFDGLAELRHKESDRLAQLHEGLNKNGVKATLENDSLIIEGQETIAGGQVMNAHHDHRMAMAWSLLSLVSERPILVEGAECIKTSFPSFAKVMRALGATVEEGIEKNIEKSNE